jgi:hypothetical protein
MVASPRVWLTYLLLLLLAVPWYWAFLPGATRLLFGMPLWVVSALAGSLCVSCYTGWLLRRTWPDEETDGSGA